MRNTILIQRLKKFKNEKGTVFITTLLTLVMISLISMATYKLVQSQNYFMEIVGNDQRATTIAEAGLADAFEFLDSDGFPATYPSQIAAAAFDDGFYTATISASSYADGFYTEIVGATSSAGGAIWARYLVESTGTYEGRARTVSAEVSGPVATGSILDYSISVNGQLLTLTGSTGSVYTNGAVTFLGGTGISGNCVSNGQITMNSGQIIGMSTSPVNIVPAGGATLTFPSPPLTLPTVQTATYLSYYTSNGTYVNLGGTGTATYTPTTLPAGLFCYVNGNVIINDNTVGNQTVTHSIVATGDITINCNYVGGNSTSLTLNAPSISNPTTWGFADNGASYPPALMSINGNITINTATTGTFTADSIIARNGTVTIGKSTGAPTQGFVSPRQIVSASAGGNWYGVSTPGGSPRKLVGITATSGDSSGSFSVVSYNTVS